jgi:hypothetical protein
MFRIDAKQAKKSLFFASKRKKFRFRFASFRFEAKMTAHPSFQHGHETEEDIGEHLYYWRHLNIMTFTFSKIIFFAFFHCEIQVGLFKCHISRNYKKGFCDRRSLR